MTGVTLLFANIATSYAYDGRILDVKCWIL